MVCGLCIQAVFYYLSEGMSKIVTAQNKDINAGSMHAPGNIVVKGARVNNLKNVDVEFPRNRFTVVTGLSGSGKSSLAFDTLYAEGQRRYVESLSAYARQFLGRMHKPECDCIKGLPPAIAIEQKVNTRNPRSTVGTSTEIYDYMRLLFGRVGHTYSPVTGREVRKEGVSDVLAACAALPEGTRIAIAAPVSMPDKRRFVTQLDVYLKAGYTRMVNECGEFETIEDLLASADSETTDTGGRMLLVDRTATSADADELNRIAESAETAFFEGHDTLVMLIWSKPGEAPERREYSTRFEADGIRFMEPAEQMFNFNNPYGACPTCEGFGKTMGIAENRVIPNPGLSVYDDAVMCWRGPKMSEYKREFIHAASKVGFPIHRPYHDLTQEEKDMLWHGVPGSSGIDGFFDWVRTQQHKIQYRVMLANYRGKTTCPTCHGSRLRKEASYVKVGGKTISELVTMPVSELLPWFANLTLDEHDAHVAKRLLVEIRNRLTFLDNVGLGYLTLDRLSNSLSGGESQRINLATSLGSSLVGSLYILDEPSIGLHSRDTERLVGVLRSLQRIGNTVVVVEHDEDIMRHADYIVDVGPDAGSHGGHIVYQGPFDRLPEAQESHTADYLTGRACIEVPAHRRKSSSYIEIKGAREHNLKDLDVRIPLGVFNVVTGVSGSGKSTLVRDILWRALARHFGQPADAPGKFDGLKGDMSSLGNVEFVDQNPIGKSSRSNPATYLKAYDEIRKLYADTQLSKQMGFTPAHFSFNTDGGRCEECKGEGTITIEMQFMSDITVECEACHGQRFKPEILEVKYRGKSITEILDMTVDDAIEFFSADTENTTARRVAQRLQPLSDVGLGYIKLGQSSSTLSGGENQRVKLAYFLGGAHNEPTMFIFDEPTTGLHLHDIKTLLKSFDRLISEGHTVLVIEHNLDVIKCADYVIDIGPEGGDRGGNLVFAGTPEALVASDKGYTARYLAPKLKG